MLGAWEESTKTVAQSAFKKAVCSILNKCGGVVLVLSQAVKFKTNKFL